jgi:hypothetical protein
LKSIIKKYSQTPLKKADYIIFAVIATACLLFFQQEDILHTAGSSFGILNGHVLDFYDYNANFDIHDSYMASSYYLFAVWNLPLRLLGIVTEPSLTASTGVILWYKLLPVLFYMAAAVLVMRIAGKMGMNQEKSRLCGYLFLTCPIGFYSQFIFGQYDIFTVFLVLLGLYYYLDDRMLAFTICFGFAVTFKYYALLLFIPFLLLKEKRVWQIIKYVLICLLPYLAEFLLAFSQSVFREYVLGFPVVGYIFQAAIDTGYAKISLVVLVWGMICAFSYFTSPADKKNEIEWLLFYGCLAVFSIFGLSMWHPQWLLLGVPFWVLSTAINKNSKIFFVLDIAAMLLFTMFTVNYWGDTLGEELFQLGILNGIFPYGVGAKVNMASLFVFKDTNLIFSLFSLILLVFAVFKHPRNCSDDFACDLRMDMGWIRTRFLLGVAIFVVPATLCMLTAFINPKMIYSGGSYYENLGELSGTQTVSQTIQGRAGSLEYIEVLAGTYDRVNASEMEVRVVDAGTEECLYASKVSAGGFANLDYTRIYTPGAILEEGKTYRIEFVFDQVSEGDGITFGISEEKNEEDCFAIVDGQAQDYNLCLRAYVSK